MKVEYIAQPDVQIGRVLSELLECEPLPSRVVFVSAFVGLQTIMRVKQQVADLRDNGVDVRFVMGIDLGGTSQDVLEEILAWNVDARIVKHRRPGHTFHPKIYLFQWNHQGIIIIGSNNLTEGGFFGNYEGAARVTYELPGDSSSFDTACAVLKRFLDPQGPVSCPLTPGFLKKLIARGEVPTEDEAREGRDIARKKSAMKRNRGSREDIFGVEAIEPPPPLPAGLLERLVANVRARRQKTKKPPSVSMKRKLPPQLPINDQTIDSLVPAAFYMTLPKLQGKNIPGEGRIPLEAIELAKEFWGWPDEYSKVESPRAGDKRVYWNWRPTWCVWSVQTPGAMATLPVRMYMYENSSDFRFYARPLVNAGGNLGDVVRIRRMADAKTEYECVLARQGTAEYDGWIKYCSQPVRNSPRRFGYA